MLSKDRRLNLSKSFKWVSQGQRTETSSLKLLYRFGENTQPLVGIALTTKLFRKAHDRNRVKRLIAEAISQEYGALQRNLNLVIMPKSQAIDLKPEQLTQEIKNVKTIYSSN